MKYFCIANKRQKDVISLLKGRGYPSDPVKAWKAAVSKGHVESDSEEGSSNESPDDQGMDYDYLVGLSGWYLTLKKRKNSLNSVMRKYACIVNTYIVQLIQYNRVYKIAYDLCTYIYNLLYLSVRLRNC